MESDKAVAKLVLQEELLRSAFYAFSNIIQLEHVEIEKKLDELILLDFTTTKLQRLCASISFKVGCEIG